MPNCPKCGTGIDADDEFCPECGERPKPKEKGQAIKTGSMYECPICHKPGITAWRKACLGPALPTTCQHCGKKVGVPYSSILAVLPFIFAILMLFFIAPIVLKGLVLLIGCIIMAVLHMKFVPLIPKE